jgi:PKD repeat protein
MNKYFLTSILTMVMFLMTTQAQAQSCQACFITSVDTTNPSVINLDASCSQAPSGIVDYEWSVDGVPYVTLPFPMMQIPFATNGAHLITLQISGGGCADTVSQSVTISPACNASFYANPISSNVYFSNVSNSSQNTYTWSFGDGTTGTGANPTHIYATNGIYAVQCTTYNANTNPPCFDVAYQSITVGGFNPTSCQACFTTYVDTANPQIVYVDASCSQSPAGVFNYAWSVDGQPYVTLPFPSTQIPLPTNGSHLISLLISNAGCSDTVSQIVNGSIGCDATFYPNTFGGNAYFTNVTYANQATYTWDFGDGTFGNNANPTHFYSALGTYTVCCTMTDATTNPACTNTFCQTINITNPSPTGCQAILYNYVDPTGFYYLDASTSNYDPSNFSMQFYVNGVLVSSGQIDFYTSTFTQAGTYFTSLIITDSMGNPCDSTFQVLYYNPTTNPTCYACVNVYSNATLDSLYIDATCSNIPQGGTIEWVVNGVPLLSNAVNQLIGFATTGNQTIELFVKDSSGNICDSTYQSGWTQGPPCTSCLSVTQVGGSTSDYIFDAACTSGVSFGYYFMIDNNYVATSPTPQFNYSFTQSGTYNVCVMSFDSSGFQACTQACQTVVVNTPTVTQFTLSGIIYKYDLNNFVPTPTTASEAKVYLIKLGTGGTLTAIDSTFTNAFGQYTFNNMPIDDYRVKAALMPSSADYSFNVPTYYQSGAMWYDAQVVTLFGNSYGRDIVLNPGFNTGGNGFIGGNVFAGANKPARGGVEEVTLILMDMTSNKPAAYTKPDANGDYAFTNITNGSYKIFGEILNRASVPDPIVVSSVQNTYTNKNFMYNDFVIKPTTNNAPQSTKDVAKQSNIKMFPNPATNHFTIVNTDESRTIRVFDVVGKLLISFDMKANAQKVIDVRNWTKGIYVIQEEANGSVKSNRMLIQ